MAIIKLLRINETSGASKHLHLKKNIFYICNPEKTGGGLYIGGNAGNDPLTIYRTMKRNKEFWGKTDMRQGYHYTISFPPDCSVGENLALKIGEEFCRKLFEDDFYYVCAVHNDKPHMHVHITFDSVSKTDGYKFHSPLRDWEKRIQPIVDELCAKYNIPTLQYDPDKKRGKNYGDWKHDRKYDPDKKQGKNYGDWKHDRKYDPDKKQGKNYSDWKHDRNIEKENVSYTWYDIIRDDIDEAIQNSNTFEEVIAYLKKQKYTIWNKKYLTVKPPGREKGVRTSRLGAGYTKEDIINRLQSKKLTFEMTQRMKTYGNRVEMRNIIFAKLQKVPGWKMSPFQKQFFQRWNFTYFIRKPGISQPWKYKKDILEVQKLADAIRYTVDFDINTVDDLKCRKEKLEQEAQAINLEIRMLRARLYKSQSVGQGDIEKLKEQIAEKRILLRDARQEIKLADSVFHFYYEINADGEMERSIPSAKAVLTEEEEKGKIQLENDVRKEEKVWKL